MLGLREGAADGATMSGGGLVSSMWCLQNKGDLGADGPIAVAPKQRERGGNELTATISAYPSPFKSAIAVAPAC
jgi:hypothetical protein